MANVIITMTVDLNTFNQDNLGRTITHSVEGAELVKHDLTNSKLDEIKVWPGDYITFKLLPLDASDTTSTCMPRRMNAKSGFNLSTIYTGNQENAGTNPKRLDLELHSAFIGGGSSIEYELTLSINDVEYTFDPKMTVNIRQPLK